MSSSEALGTPGAGVPRVAREAVACLELAELEAGPLPPERLAHSADCPRCQELLAAWTAEQALLENLRTARGAAGTAAARAPVEIPGYQVIREVRRGGQGVVLEAIQQGTKRRVAIKLMLGGPLASEDARRRFQREIELLADLRHANIVTVFDGGEVYGWQFLVMDFIDGLPLTRYIREHEPATPDVVRLFARIASAVAAAHAAGIVHRDLKPSNILVNAAGEPFLLDFGVARARAAGAEPAPTVTWPDAVVGTLNFMSPEQATAAGSVVGPWSDVYALGVLLYEALVGEMPYPVEGPPAEVIRSIAEAVPRPPRRAARKAGIRAQPLDPELERVLLKALEKEPVKRYANAATLRDDLERWLRGERVRAPARGWPALARAHFRSAARRFPRAAVLLALTVSFGVALFTPHWLAQAGVDPLSLLGPFEQYAIQRFDHCRVVLFKDAARMQQLAEAGGLDGVTADNVTSWRRLHGALMRRLADSGCRAIVWDVVFRGSSDFDDDLVAGVERLRGANIATLVALERWQPTDDETVSVSPKLLPHVRAGVAHAGPHDYADTFEVYLAVQRAELDALPHLMLEAYAAAVRPSLRSEAIIQESDSPRLLLRYRPPGAAPAAIRQYKTDARDEIALTMVSEATADVAGGGLHAGDKLAVYICPLPTGAALTGATLDYAAVFEASPSRLREWFADRVVVVADGRPGVDRHRVGQRPDVHGAHLNATVLETLLRGPGIRAPESTAMILTPLSGALLGGLIARGARFSAWRRGAAYIMVVAVVVSGVIWGDVLLPHYALAVGLVCAGELSGAVLRDAAGLSR